MLTFNNNDSFYFITFDSKLRNMKNTPIIITSIATIGIVVAMGILGYAIKNRNSSENTISVTGLGTKQFTSDLITWSGSFSRTSDNLRDAYNELNSDKKEIHNYLQSKGIKANEFVFSAVNIEKKYNYYTDANGHSQSSFTGYELSQNISIESKEVEKIENIARNITEIIDLGIEFTSSSPQYFYTKLAEVKQQMIADATKDAKQRAQKIAENAGSDLGSLKKATMGVIQITAPNSNEDYSYGGAFNTHSKQKEASITIKLEYQVD